MILDKEIEIKVNSTTLKHYKEIGYCVKMGETIKIKIEDLTKGSHSKINVKCDNCGFEKKIPYKDYLKQIEKYHNYFCSKCWYNRISSTIFDNFGVKNISQLENIKINKKNSSIKTCLKKYNSNSYLGSDEAKNKIKKTVKDKYKVDNVFQLEEIKNKSKKTKLEKYGDENYSNTEKYKNTMIELYGNVNYNNKEQYKKTCLEIYGVDNASKSNIIKLKIIETSQKRYNVNNPIQDKEIFLKNQLSGFRTKYYSDNLYYRGTYEKDFLDKCKNMKIFDHIENFKGSINYIYDGNRKYFPDFFIKNLNLIVEIKSSLYYYLHLYKNIAKIEHCLKKGYNFILILDKKYEEFEKIINNERNLL